MAANIASAVLGQDKPRGLKRFTLLLLALYASDDGSLAFGEADQRRLSAAGAMRSDRFSRIVEELRFDGHLSVADGVVRVYTEGVGGAAVGQIPSQTSLLQDKTLASGTGVVGGSSESPENAVNAVLAFYTSLFGPRQWGADDKREVRAALEVAKVEEIKEAIQGNKLSDFHQGENRQEKKYNTLGHIIRGKKGTRTRRENIDMFREIYAKAKATTGGSVKAGSADPAIVAARKEEVRRAFRLSLDEEAQERGRRAEEWLKEQGIATRRKPDGYPIWPEREQPNGGK